MKRLLDILISIIVRAMGNFAFWIFYDVVTKSDVNFKIGYVTVLEGLQNNGRFLYKHVENGKDCYIEAKDVLGKEPPRDSVRYIQYVKFLDGSILYRHNNSTSRSRK